MVLIPNKHLSRRFISLIAFAPALLAAHGSRADDSVQSKLAAVEKTIDSKREELHIPGAALVIVKDDKIIYIKGLGQRDVANRLPVTPDTLFAIGSSTKAFTAMTVMMTADEGKLQLTDSPAKYLPYFRLQDEDANRRITISDLLCHRSGLNRTDLAWYTGRLRAPDIIRVACAAKPTAKFGEKFQYQNIMFLTAGEIVAKTQKTAWTDIVTRRILKPLGMNSTNLSVPVMLETGDHSEGYTWDEGKKQAIHLPMRDLGCIAPAGAINSNAKDMAQWVRFMLNRGVVNGKRLVSEENFDALTVKRIDLGPGTGYGYGWFLHDWHGHKVVEHGGNIDGFNAQVALMPDQNLGFVLLTNVSASPLGSQAMEAVWSNFVQLPEGTKTVAPTSVAGGPAVSPDGEVGKYYLAVAKMTFEVSLKDGKPMLTISGQGTVPLVSVGGRRYKLGGPAPDGLFLTFRPTKDDPKLSEAYLEQPQGNFVLVKQQAAAYTGPMTVEELMRKQVEALGGESKLRNVRSMMIRFDLAMEDQGIVGSGTEWFEAPGRHAQTTNLFAAGKHIAGMHDYCDGKRAGNETSFGPADVKEGNQLKDEVVDAEMWPALAWKSLFKTVTITKMDKVDGEEVYVVEKKQETGRIVSDYISAKSFLLVKVEKGGVSETYSDYRTVNGVKVSFKHVALGPTGGRSTTTVKQVAFNRTPGPDVFLPTKAAGPQEAMSSWQ